MAALFLILVAVPVLVVQAVGLAIWRTLYWGTKGAVWLSRVLYREFKWWFLAVRYLYKWRRHLEKLHPTFRDDPGTQFARRTR